MRFTRRKNGQEACTIAVHFHLTREQCLMLVAARTWTNAACRGRRAFWNELRSALVSDGLSPLYENTDDEDQTAAETKRRHELAALMGWDDAEAFDPAHEDSAATVPN